MDAEDSGSSQSPCSQEEPRKAHFLTGKEPGMARSGSRIWGCCLVAPSGPGQHPRELGRQGLEGLCSISQEPQCGLQGVGQTCVRKLSRALTSRALDGGQFG